MSETNKVPVMRKNAQVNITFGTVMIQKLQQVLISIMIEKTDEEINAFNELLKTGVTEFEEPWMNHYWTMAALLTSIEQAAQEQGFIDYVDQDEAASLLDS